MRIRDSLLVFIPRLPKGFSRNSSPLLGLFSGSGNASRKAVNRGQQSEARVRVGDLAFTLLIAGLCFRPHRQSRNTRTCVGEASSEAKDRYGSRTRYKRENALLAP